MSRQSTYLGSLQREKSDDTMFNDMQIVAILEMSILDILFIGSVTIAFIFIF